MVFFYLNHTLKIIDTALIKEREEADTFYIGRFGFTHDNEKLIFDWRAPISGMFYDFCLGRAGFEAPVGWIEGELTIPEVRPRSCQNRMLRFEEKKFCDT